MRRRKPTTKDRLVMTLISLLATLVAFIPLWIYLFANWLFEPTGFWQRAVLAGFGLWAMGGLQFILFICLIIFLVLFLGS